MTKRTEEKSKARAAPRAGPEAGPPHPHIVPTLDTQSDPERRPDQPFEEGSHDAISSDRRQRMISETAYRYYTDRGYVDGYHMDDWFQAEVEVDHLLLNPRSG